MQGLNSDGVRGAYEIDDRSQGLFLMRLSGPPAVHYEQLPNSAVFCRLCNGRESSASMSDRAHAFQVTLLESYPKPVLSTCQSHRRNT